MRSFSLSLATSPGRHGAYRNSRGRFRAGKLAAETRGPGKKSFVHRALQGETSQPRTNQPTVKETCTMITLPYSDKLILFPTKKQGLPCSPTLGKQQRTQQAIHLTFQPVFIVVFQVPRSCGPTKRKFSMNLVHRGFFGFPS